MDFIIFVLAFGAGFVTVTYITEILRSTELVKKDNEEKKPDCRQTNTMHSWKYGDDGYMVCKVCNKRPLSD